MESIINLKEDELRKLMMKYENSINRLYNIERKILENKKTRINYKEDIKVLNEDLEISRFEVDHLSYLLEKKENERKGAEKLLNENEKLLGKYKNKYISSVKVFERSIGELAILVDTIPQIEGLGELHWELKELQDENLELNNLCIKQKEMLKDIEQLESKQNIDNNTKREQVAKEELENRTLDKVKELIVSFEGFDKKISSLEKEITDWKNKYYSLEKNCKKKQTELKEQLENERATWEAEKNKLVEERQEEKEIAKKMIETEREEFISKTIKKKSKKLVSILKKKNKTEEGGKKKRKRVSIVLDSGDNIDGSPSKSFVYIGDTPPKEHIKTITYHSSRKKKKRKSTLCLGCSFLIHSDKAKIECTKCEGKFKRSFP